MTPSQEARIPLTEPARRPCWVKSFKIMFNHLRNCHMVFSKWLHHFTPQPAVYEGLLCILHHPIQTCLWSEEGKPFPTPRVFAHPSVFPNTLAISLPSAAAPLHPSALSFSVTSLSASSKWHVHTIFSSPDIDPYLTGQIVLLFACLSVSPIRM